MILDINMNIFLEGGLSEYDLSTRKPIVSKAIIVF